MSNREKREEEFSQTDEPSNTESFSIEDISQEDLKTLGEKIAKQREDTRSVLAERFLWILIGTYTLSFITMLGVLLTPIFTQINKELRDESYVYTKDIISILITTQTGLVGSIMGFYFGSSSDSK